MANADNIVLSVFCYWAVEIKATETHNYASVTMVISYKAPLQKLSDKWSNENYFTVWWKWNENENVEETQNKWMKADKKITYWMTQLM